MCFVGFKAIDLIHHLMERCVKIRETDLEDNQTIFNEAIDTTIALEIDSILLKTASSMQMVSIRTAHTPKSSTRI